MLATTKYVITTVKWGMIKIRAGNPWSQRGWVLSLGEESSSLSKF